MKAILERKLDFLGLEGYSVDTEGNVWSSLYGKEKELKKLKPMKNSVGYYQVYLPQKCGKYKWFRIHRLVAIAFIPNIENKSSVDHINGDKTDNRVSNLRWVTHKENHNNPIAIERHRKAISKARSLIKNHKGGRKRKAILQFDLKGNLIKEWDSCYNVHDELGYTTSYISHCAKKNKVAFKSIWKYK